VIHEDEAIVMTGFDMHMGIDFYGSVPEDWKRRCVYFNSPKAQNAVIAIDNIRPKWRKYKRKNIEWCVKKAYCGFQGAPTNEIVTGGWGCGVFLNNANVMYCVQVLAAWLANKALIYHCDPDLRAIAVVKKWAGMWFEDALTDLVSLCERRKDFETSWIPNPNPVQSSFLDQFMPASGVNETFASRTVKGHLDASVIAHISQEQKNNMPLVDFDIYAKKKWGAKPSGPAPAGPSWQSRSVSAARRP